MTERSRVGRRNRYTINRDLTMRHASQAGYRIGGLIDVAKWLESRLGRELEGQVYKAGAFAPVSG